MILKGAPMRILAILCVCFLTASCGFARKHAVDVGVNEIQPLTESPRPLGGVQIIQSPGEFAVDERFAAAFEEELTEELEAEGFTVGEGEGEVRLYYRFMALDVRSRALRFFFAPSPAFNSTAVVEAIFLAPNGARIGHLRVVGVTQGAFLGYEGVLGGDSTLAAERAADRIADRFVDTYAAAGE